LMRKNLDDAVDRLSDFYDRRGDNEVFIRIDVQDCQADLSTERRLLNRRTFPDVKWLYSHWERYLTKLYNLEDDSTPTIYLSPYDQGLYGAILGAELVVDKPMRIERTPFWIGSMTKPLEHFSLEELGWSEENPWLERFRSDLRYVAERARGRFGVGVLMTIDALNFVAQVLGITKALIWLYRRPDDAKRLMEFAFELNVRLVEMQRDIIDFTYKGGVFDFYGGWLPRRAVPMSVDLYNFCRPQMYTAMGRTYQQRLIDRFGGGIYHVHENGYHLIPELAKMRNVLAIWITDHNVPIHKVKALREMAGSIPLIIDCTKHQFLRGLREKTIERGVMYNIKAKNLSEANLLARKAKSL